MDGASNRSERDPRKRISHSWTFQKFKNGQQQKHLVFNSLFQSFEKFGGVCAGFSVQMFGNFQFPMFWPSFGKYLACLNLAARRH